MHVLGFCCSSHSDTLTSDCIQETLGTYSEAVGLQTVYGGGGCTMALETASTLSPFVLQQNRNLHPSPSHSLALPVPLPDFHPFPSHRYIEHFPFACTLLPDDHPVARVGDSTSKSEPGVLAESGPHRQLQCQLVLIGLSMRHSFLPRASDL